METQPVPSESVPPEELAVERTPKSRQPLSILDMFIVTLIVAVHLFHFPLAVHYRDSSMMYLVPLIPTLIAIWIQVRARLRIRTAIIVHYAVSVSWALLYGVGYASALNREVESPAFYEDPMSKGIYLAEEMMFVALFTTFLYGVMAVCIRRAKKLQRKRP